MLGWMECLDVVKLRVAAWRGQFRLRLRRGRDGEAGFTLVEMLVVITIIGLIMGLVGPRVLSYLSDSKLKTARIQIRSLSSALDLYHLDNGRYPTAAEGLGALVQKPATATTWNGPYLSGTLVPNDPWGRPYVYRFPGQHGTYDIVSLGPEGREDETSATANVTSWQP
ncbi:pseudopilin, cryptic, general secretion pathway [Bradyrhizobium oligotrophicum S58]|uniref:Type II secretion system core protein G n=1 Tax=Bradyrhizobium oligotrophicum S58 TaxID=1245469 RepID=M4Z2F4_9BRAD|nr:pseudopilin, cryptic, general secretion pathway [Bradyrhizobium oligotrophicum S58]